jgi:AraC-like DNA-binding protein
VEDLAREVGVSRSALAQRFTELTGEAPMRYLTGWRIQLAKHLMLQTGLPIAEVADRVGYESEAAFNRAFKREVGAPPVTWRKGMDRNRT